MSEYKASLTVVIPTHNRPQLLNRTLCSIGNGLLLCNVIVVDDRSEPDNAAEVERIVSQYHAVDLLRVRQGSGGACRARNLGLRASSSDYVWFLDDDDTVTLELVQDVTAGLRSPDPVGLVLPTVTFYADATAVERVPTRQDCNVESVRRKANPANTSGLVFHRASLCLIGGWDTALVAGQDTDLMLRYGATFGFRPLPTPHRVHVDGGTHDRITNRPFRRYTGNAQVLWRHLGSIGPPRLLSYIASVFLGSPFWSARLRRAFRAIGRKSS